MSRLERPGIVSQAIIPNNTRPREYNHYAYGGGYMEGRDRSSASRNLGNNFTNGKNGWHHSSIGEQKIQSRRGR